MNYIELINNFWRVEEAYQFSGWETKLYFYLVKTANGLAWQNDFWHSDGKTSVNIGISINSLKTCRNKLSQAGLIQFKGGGKGYGDKTRYQILTPNLQPKVQPKPHPKVQPNLQPLSKLNEKKHSSSGDKPPVKKKKEFSESTKHWKKLVDTWFVFYKSKFKAEPTFNGPATISLKSIIDRIEKIAERESKNWTEEYAARCLQKFYENAYSDDWISKNFLLSNLSSKFDVIVNQNGNSKTHTKSSGAKGGTIDELQALKRGAAEEAQQDFDGPGNDDSGERKEWQEAEVVE